MGSVVAVMLKYVRTVDTDVTEACCTNRGELNNKVISERIRAIETAEDAVRLIRAVSHMTSDAQSTDDVQVRLVDALLEYYHTLTCEEVQRISRLHKTYASTCHDHRAYALTLVWSSIVSVTSDNTEDPTITAASPLLHS